MKILFIILLCFTACAWGEPVIVQKPIMFNKERIELTKKYRKEHYGIDESKPITIVPRMIVLHWTEIPTFTATYDAFYQPTLSKSRSEIISAGNLNVSAQFLVNRDGVIYQLMPSNWMARHTIGLNNVAIGIENVGGVNGQQNLTEAQVRADAYLIRWLVKKYPTIQYLIGHYEYSEFRNSPLWQEKNPQYITPKTDPGPIFMRKVRADVADLHLKNHP